jgi:exportin-7
MVQQQLEQFSTIERCEYEKTCTCIVQLFDQTAGSYQDTINKLPTATSSIDLQIHEGQLTWLVYIIGSAIGGRMSFQANDDHDIMDGDLMIRVSSCGRNVRV